MYKLLVKIRDSRDGKEYVSSNEFEKEETRATAIQKTIDAISDPEMPFFSIKTEKNELVIISGIKLRRDCVVTFCTSQASDEKG